MNILLLVLLGAGRGVGVNKAVDQSKQNAVLLVVTWTEFNMPPCPRGGRPFGSVGGGGFGGVWVWYLVLLLPPPTDE